MITKGFRVTFVRLTLIAFMALTFTVAPAESATINVTASAADVLLDGNGSCALREAIQNINDGASTYADCTPASGAYGTSDLINLPAGTYTNAIAGAGENVNATGDLDITKSVTFNGAGAGSTFIDGGAIDRVFHVDPTGAGGVVVNIDGVTIQNGSAVGSNGAGIYHKGLLLTVTNSTISGNSAGAYGGGIYSYGGTVTITGSTISNNTSASSGGGIYNFTAALSITNSTISGNTASFSGGGGIYNSSAGGDLTVSNSTISGNHANDNTTGDGGGINNAGGGILTITNSIISNNVASRWAGGIFTNTTSTLNATNVTISGNTAGKIGGGIYNNGGTVTVDGSTISGNSANSSSAGTAGGGIWTYGTFTITNSTISGNSVASTWTQGDGGGILNNGTLNATNVTISGNSADHWGGGYYDNGAGTFNTTNVTITANTAGTSGGGIYSSGGTVNLKNTIVANQAGGGDCNVTVTSTLNDLDSDGSCGATTTGDPLLDVLANNGGTTLTHALQSCSPAIDAGTNTGCPATDQRGTARPQGGTCDIGAYEYVPVISPPSATTDPAGGVGATGATLNGTVNDNGADTTVTFDYGTTAGYGTTVAAVPSPVPAGSCATPVSKAIIAGLTCGTTYHYRVVGVNSAGTTNGTDANFTTTACGGVVQTFQLTVETGGSGAGAIYTAAHDIDCPHGCTATYPAGTQVTLYAWEAGGSSFGGWGGVCAGTWRGAPCVVTMNQDSTATGNFDPVPASNNAPDGGDGNWLFYPDNGGSTTGAQTSILWKQLTDADNDPITYTPEVCDNPDFTNCSDTTIQQYTLAKAIGGVGAGFVGLCAFGFIVAGAGRTRKGKALALTLLIIMAPLSGVLLVSCSSSGSATDTNTPAGETYANCSSVPDGYQCATVSGLTPGATYSWRVTANDGQGGSAQSITWSFTAGQ